MSRSLVQKLRDVSSYLKKIKELIQHDDRQIHDQEVVAILDKLLQEWPEEISKYVQDLEAGCCNLLHEKQRLENQLQYTEDIAKSWTNQCQTLTNIIAKLQSDLQSAKDKEQRLSNEDQNVVNEMTKLQCDPQEKTQKLYNQQESVNISPSQLALVGIIHGHLPIDAEQGEKGEAKDKFSRFFRNSIEPLLDAMEECGVSEIESSAIACQVFQLTYNHCKEALIERMKDQLLQLFQRSKAITDEERKRMDYTKMAFSLLCHGANVHQLKMKEDQTLLKKIQEDVEKYSILQQEPTIQQEFDKLLTSAIETAQSLISCVPPMVVDCFPNPDFRSKAYPTLQGDPTNYVITQPALFFSYEADGDKINGKCELMPHKSHCFSRNWSDEGSGVQVSKKEPKIQTEQIKKLRSGFPQREGCFSTSDRISSTKKSKNSQLNQQPRKRSHATSEQHDIPCPHVPPHIRPTVMFLQQKPIEDHL